MDQTDRTMALLGRYADLINTYGVGSPEAEAFKKDVSNDQESVELFATADFLRTKMDAYQKRRKEERARRLTFSRWLREYPNYALMTVLVPIGILPIIAMIAGKILNRIIIAPDAGIALVICSIIFFAAVSLAEFNERRYPDANSG